MTVLSNRNATNTERMAFLKRHRFAKTDDCIYWPFPVSRGKKGGYGNVNVKGKPVSSSRAMLFISAGPPPSPSHHAAHSCGNRSCVNPRHLRWATPSENQRDRLLHGTDSRGEKSGNSKLTSSEVVEIKKAIARGFSNTDLGRRFGVSRTAIRLIRIEENWRHIHVKEFNVWLDQTVSPDADSIMRARYLQGASRFFGFDQ